AYERCIAAQSHSFLKFQPGFTPTYAVDAAIASSAMTTAVHRPAGALHPSNVPNAVLPARHVESDCEYVSPSCSCCSLQFRAPFRTRSPTVDSATVIPPGAFRYGRRFRREITWHERCGEDGRQLLPMPLAPRTEAMLQSEPLQFV